MVRMQRQDTTVRNEHEQMEMPMPPKVLCHEHNHQSAQSADKDKDAKQEESVWLSRQTMSMQLSANKRLRCEEEGGKKSVICKDSVGYKYRKCISTQSK